MDYLSELQKRSQGYLQQMNALNAALKQYTPATSSDAMRDFSARVGNLAPQYGELRGMESQMQQTPGQLMSQYLQQYGGTTGLDPMARLNAIQAQMANQRGTTNVMRDVIGQQQNKLEQLANSAVQAYAQEQAARQNQYANINDLYKTIVGQIESEKNRRATASNFNFGGGGGENPNKQTTGVLPGQKAVAPGQQYVDASGQVKTAGKNGVLLTNEDASAYAAWLSNKALQQQTSLARLSGLTNIGQSLYNLNPLSSLISGNMGRSMQNGWNTLTSLFR